MPRPRKTKPTPASPPAASAAAAPGDGEAPRVLGRPAFAQAQPTPDPTTFRIQHPSDGPAYKAIDELNREHKLLPMRFPAPRGGSEPSLTLDQVLGQQNQASRAITARGQLVFHATGDCGNTRGPQTETLVADKMVSDFDEDDAAQIPQFNLLLGDIVYSFGEAQYYYDQFYEPYRNYPAPILALAGNHDGMISPLAHATTLAAFLRNFCASEFAVLPEAGNLTRTAQIQPGVFFTFEAPFVRILALYSNTLEDPGVIADSNIGSSQIAFLRAALQRVKKERYAGALLFAHHHPPYALGSRHGWSTQMLAQMDAVCAETGIWPHAVLSGHAHNYQRFTRHRSADKTQIPYVVCGNGGHNVLRLQQGRSGGAIRVPQVIQAAGAHADEVVFESYDDENYGYLRILVNANQLRIEYHPAYDGAQAKTPDDSVTVDLASRQLASFKATNQAWADQAKSLRRERAGKTGAAKRSPKKS